MEISIRKIKRILVNSQTVEIENTIANEVGCDIYKDDVSILLELIVKEIKCSGLSIKKIENYIYENKEIIISFGIKLIGNRSPEFLSTGIAITYSIYLIYLEEKSEKQLLEYIRKRRIPNAESFLKQLLSIKRN
ncbi:MAG: hypothetical protein ACLFQU_11840 [Candidatus Kapaibacterium sp.]